MKKYFLLIILAAFVACSDDDVNPDQYTFQSVLDFDAGKFPTKIGDTVRYEGIVTLDPNKSNYDASVKYNAYMLIARYQYNNTLMYSTIVCFNDETNMLHPYELKKGSSEIDGEIMHIIQCLNNNGVVTRILNEYKFDVLISDEGEYPEFIDYIFKENKVKL